MALFVDLFHAWFSELSAQLTISEQIEKVSGEFAALTSDYARAEYVCSLKDVVNSLQLPDTPGGKCDLTSDKLRTEGNKYFKEGSYKEALDLYNDSVCQAESLLVERPTSAKSDDVSKSGVTGSAYSLALANRSATLFYMKHYDCCVRDVDTALNNGYPDNLAYKIYERKGRALIGLNRAKEAVVALDKAVKKIELSSLSAKKKEKLKKDLQSLMKESRAGSAERRSARNDSPQNKMNSCLPSLSGGSHHTFTSLSAKCLVEYTPESGRFITAAEEILPGEVVLVEQAYASVLLPDQYPTHCHHCIAMYIAAIPCKQCPLARYCSVECRQAASSSYHQGECKSLVLIHQSGLGKFGHLAVRTVTKTGFKALLEHRQKIKQGVFSSSPLSLGADEKGVYESDSFNAIYNLVTHDNDRKPNDLFRRALMAVFLVKCLEKAGFFPSEDNNGLADALLTEDTLNGASDAAIISGLEDLSLDCVKIITTSLILSHLQAFPCNAHEVSELVLDRASVGTSEPREIGAGIFTTLSLFNHSCNPAVVRHFYGDTCVSRAIRLIRSGEEVSDNYGAVYAVQDREERQEKLSPQYFFTCACEPCRQDWPLYPDIPAQASPVWKCEACTEVIPNNCDVCSKCETRHDRPALLATLKKSNKAYDAAFESLMSCKVKDAIPAFTAHIAFLERHVVLPWQPYNNCQETLKQCYSILANTYPATS